MVPTLHEVLAQRVSQWRTNQYHCDAFPAIAEILDYASGPEPGISPYLRQAQLRALETYWYLRVIEDTPRIIDLYLKLFQSTSDRLNALDVPRDAFEKADYALDALWARVTSDGEFVRQFKLEALRETLNLSYPSYILALAMGAGKTVLIGAIIATEFAMALEYPDGPFVQNALVFAPGKTIIESLRELADVPYDRILPPRFFKPYSATVKLTFTRDGEKDIPVIRGSAFNIVVTNTEKIRIQKEAIRKSDLGRSFALGQENEARTEIANLRLQAIASLPQLAVFSDEAHHTYGQALDTELKKVRKTVDYLAASTSLVGVVNTTGTPYFKSQRLKDVVVWYGLSEGIRDGILKDVSGNIYSFEFGGNVQEYVTHVIQDFFKDYGDVRLGDGSPTKLAMYFPQMDDLEALRPAIEGKLAELGHSPSICLRNTSASPQSEVDAFNRLNHPASPHRVILLVNKGTEGWNCPSLFACALARNLKSSNNFVLQAATRCLRQVLGNTHKARIYLSADNESILDRQLKETYNETLSDLRQSASNSRRVLICVKKLDIPPLIVKRVVRTVVRNTPKNGALSLSVPTDADVEALRKTVLSITPTSPTGRLLNPVGGVVEIATTPDILALYSVAVQLAAIYRLDLWQVHDELKRAYDGASGVPISHIFPLSDQIEQQTRHYELEEEIVEDALALIRLDGFETQITEEGTEVYTAEISYPVSREHLITRWEQMKGLAGEFGFHYTPYNFDSAPEKSFFEQLLGYLKQPPDQIEDIYFTGALTDPKKSDFAVEYKGEDNRWHRYTPDFVIQRKDGKCLIVEIKSAQFEAATKEDLARAGQGKAPVTVEGRKALALRKWEDLDPARLKYEIIFVPGDSVPHDKMQPARKFIQES